MQWVTVSPPPSSSGRGGAAPGSAMLSGCRFLGVCVRCLWHPNLQESYGEVKFLFIVLLQGGSLGARAGAPPPPPAGGCEEERACSG